MLELAIALCQAGAANLGGVYAVDVLDDDPVCDRIEVERQFRGSVCGLALTENFVYKQGVVVLSVAGKDSEPRAP